RKIRNLKIGATTLYRLHNHADEEDMPAIIAELAKHATKSQLAPRDAERVIQIGIGRRRFGDYPDVTLEQLSTLSDDSPWQAELIAALKEQRPTTDEAVEAIVDRVQEEYREPESDETKDILDGPPPLLPSQSPPENQRLQYEPSDDLGN